MDKIPEPIVTDQEPTPCIGSTERGSTAKRLVLSEHLFCSRPASALTSLFTKIISFSDSQPLLLTVQVTTLLPGIRFSIVVILELLFVKTAELATVHLPVP